MSYPIRPENLPFVDSPQSSFSETTIMMCALAVILSIGCWIAAGIGLAAYLRMSVGSLSQLSQVQGIALLGAGGSLGTLLLIASVTTALKMYKQTLTPIIEPPPTQVSKPLNRIARPIIKTFPQHCIQRDLYIKPHLKGPIYGADSWKGWNMEVADCVPQPQEIDWNAHDPYFNQPYKDNYALLYLPEKVILDGRVRDFDMELLATITPIKVSSRLGPGSLSLFRAESRGKWLLISKIIPDSLDRNYGLDTHYGSENEQETQIQMLKREGFYLPYVLEAVAFCLAYSARTGQKLFGEPINPSDYYVNTGISTRCCETYRPSNGDCVKPISVGCGQDGLRISYDWQKGAPTEGIIAVKEVGNLFGPNKLSTRALPPCINAPRPTQKEPNPVSLSIVPGGIKVWFNWNKDFPVEAVAAISEIKDLVESFNSLAHRDSEEDMANEEQDNHIEQKQTPDVPHEE